MRLTNICSNREPRASEIRDVESASSTASQKESVSSGLIVGSNASIRIVGIGVLGIPSAFNHLGIIPGNIVLFATAGTMTWSNYQIGRFKRRHPECYGLEDAAYIMFGKWGKEVFMVVFLLYWTFVTGSAYITLSTAFNALSDHSLCTAAFVAIAAVVGFLLCSVKDLKKVSVVAMPAVACIIVAVLTVTIAAPLQDRPSAAPKTGHWHSDWRLIGDATFAQVMSSISTLIFAFSGTPAFFQLEAEMKEPTHYNRAMFTCQGVVLSLYAVVGNVLYYFCGSYVSSPALGSAGPQIMKISYGISIPGILVSAMIVAHIPAKAIFMRVVRSRAQWQRHKQIDNARAWAFWLTCTCCVSICAYIVASTIPGFGNLVSLVGASVGTFISIIPYGFMWLYDNLPTTQLSVVDDFAKNRSLRQRWQGRSLRWSERTWSWKAMAFIAVFAIVSGLFCMVGGTFGSALEMRETLEVSRTSPWTCANNA